MSLSFTLCKFKSLGPRPIYTFSTTFILVCQKCLFKEVFVLKIFFFMIFQVNLVLFLLQIMRIRQKGATCLPVCPPHVLTTVKSFSYFRWQRLKNKLQFLNRILNREELLCQKDIFLVKLYCLIQNFGMHGNFPNGVVIKIDSQFI